MIYIYIYIYASSHYCVTSSLLLYSISLLYDTVCLFQIHRNPTADSRPKTPIILHHSVCVYIYIYVCIHISNRINNNPPQRYSRNLFDFDISHHWPPLTHRAIDQALPVLVSLLLLGICNEPSLELDSQDAGCHHMICVENMPMVILYII